MIKKILLFAVTILINSVAFAQTVTTFSSSTELAGPKGKLHLLRLFPSEMTAQPENMPLATTAPSVKKQTSQARRLGWFAI
jgi:hypothetical protein